MSSLKDRHIRDLLYDIFTLNDDSKWSARTVGDVKGEIKPSGLNIAFKTTTVDITDTPTKLPPTPLDNRNALSIHNTNETIKIYIGDSDGVTADNVLGTTSGYELSAKGRVNFDVTDQVELWAVAPAGQTARVKITEIA